MTSHTILASAGEQSTAEWLSEQLAGIADAPTEQYTVPVEALVAGEAQKARPRRVLHATSYEVIEAEVMRWLWRDRIPLGTVAVFAGRGGEGKSTYALHLAAQLTRGTLAGDLAGEPSPVLIVNLEDDKARVMRPRLEAAGADLTRVHHLEAGTIYEDGREVAGALSLPADVDALADLIRRSGARLVILDPASSVMGGDLSKREDARRSLDALLDVAMDTDCTFVLILHLNKGTGPASNRISGSAALRDAARSVIQFATDPDTGDRVASFDKNNYGREIGGSFAFQLVDTPIPVADEFAHVARVQDLGESQVSVSDLFAREQDGDGQHVEDRNAAVAFIVDYLTQQNDGEGKAGEILKAGRAAGFTDNELKHARTRSKSPRIESRKASFGGGWVWGIVHEGAAEGAEGANLCTPGTFGTFVAPSQDGSTGSRTAAPVSALAAETRSDAQADS